MFERLRKAFCDDTTEAQLNREHLLLPAVSLALLLGVMAVSGECGRFVGSIQRNLEEKQNPRGSQRFNIDLDILASQLHLNPNH